MIRSYLILWYDDKTSFKICNLLTDPSYVRFFVPPCPPCQDPPLTHVTCSWIVNFASLPLASMLSLSHTKRFLTFQNNLVSKKWSTCIWVTIEAKLSPNIGHFIGSSVEINATCWGRQNDLSWSSQVFFVWFVKKCLPRFLLKKHISIGCFPSDSAAKHILTLPGQQCTVVATVCVHFKLIANIF